MLDRLLILLWKTFYTVLFGIPDWVRERKNRKKEQG